MDVTTRDGNKKRFSGKAAVNPFTSKLLLEGPLTKYKEGKTTSSFIVSTRTSYIDQSSQGLYNYVDTAGLPYNFTDVYAKMSINAVNGSKFSLYGFSFTDQVRFDAPAALSWRSSGIGGNFVVVPQSASVLVDGTFAYSNYFIEQPQLDVSPRKSEINGFNGALNFTYFYGKDELKYGVEMLGFKTDFIFTNSANVIVQQQQYTTELAGYLKYKYIKNRLILEPSMRAQYYA